MERESMDFDVVIVGAGPAGLAAAIRIMQLSQQHSLELQVCVVEKGSEVGAHILSGAILETNSLTELLPNWSDDAPIQCKVKQDDVFYFRNETHAIKFPHTLIPKPMHNDGNYIVSMGNVCRWLAEKAEALGVEIFPGFAAAEVIFDDNGAVCGILTGDMGISKEGKEKDSYMPGMALRAKYTLFAEGSRGHLGKQLIHRFDLAKDKSPQHYGLGFKEIWEVPKEVHQPGLVAHSAGWPLLEGTSGGSYLYHAENQQIVVGLIVDLNYQNPYLSPFDEFQRLKLHPKIKQYLDQGKRISYGARVITKGGWNSLPKMVFAGGFLIGCDAGTVNFAKIKGNHTAIKSGMLAAETVISALQQGDTGQSDLSAEFDNRFKSSWLYDELYSARNFGPALHKMGSVIGGAFNWFDQNIFQGKLPFTLKDETPDYATLQRAKDAKKIDYPKPDNQITFDKLSSVYLSNTNHEEDQPVHLKLADASIPIKVNLPDYAEPAQRYCPAGVYEVVEENGEQIFKINAQNCIHCKTCDIKDPAQNITWVVPEGAGGPNYPNM